MFTTVLSRYIRQGINSDGRGKYPSAKCEPYFTVTQSSPDTVLATAPKSDRHYRWRSLDGARRYPSSAVNGVNRPCIYLHYGTSYPLDWNTDRVKREYSCYNPSNLTLNPLTYNIVSDSWWKFSIEFGESKYYLLLFLCGLNMILFSFSKQIF